MKMIGILIAEAKLKRGTEEGILKELRAPRQGVVIQIVSLPRRPVESEVAMIAEQTGRAMRRGSLLAEKPEVDLLLRLAGTTQITEAISRRGYRGKGRRFLIAFGDLDGVASLKKALRGAGGFSLVGPEESGKEDLSAVEAAALLAARKA
jgi:tRNA threonylcarbamoyladenosine modification (KEOPS) complex Cgi121 subunit